MTWPVLVRAQEFSDSLARDQRAALHRPYSLQDAARWSNYPQGFLSGGERRVGLQTATLRAPQWAALDALLAAALGTRPGTGFDEVQQHLRTDDWVRRHGAGDRYGRGQFFIAFLGEPSSRGLWELQFGGHHLAVANTYADGELVGATPSFRGIEPFRPVEQDGVVNDAGAPMHRAFAALLVSLDEQQRRAARIGERRSDLLLGPGRDRAFPAHGQGLGVSGLSDPQQALVIDVMRTFVDAVDDASAARILDRYRGELGDTRLAFAGDPRLSAEGDYALVDGPGAWMELSMRFPVVAPGTHPHAVWRDRRTDYGGRLA